MLSVPFLVTRLSLLLGLEAWLLSLNAQKCKVVPYNRNADKNYKYKMIQQDRIIELDREDHY